MAAQRITGRQLAAEAGFSSQNYLAIRLRDEKPLTLDDLERICQYFDVEAQEFVRAADANHGERIWAELMEIDRTEREATVHVTAGSGKTHSIANRAGLVASIDPDERAKTKRPAKRSASSFEDADIAARHEDSEKPQLSDQSDA